MHWKAKSSILLPFQTSLPKPALSTPTALFCHQTPQNPISVNTWFRISANVWKFDPLRFMTTRPHPFTRCDITVLLPQTDGTFLRASYNQNELGYPASTIKLAYLVSAINWCKSSGKSFNCLDSHVRPMIYTSDNFETGVVVDFITGTTNYHPVNQSIGDPSYRAWWQKRNYTTSYFASRGLLEDQVLISKTYPTNSGSMPSGAESILRQFVGMNQMKPKCAASLMAEIAGGIIHPDATEYMLGILQHARYSYTSFGMGTPPGSVMYNKVGNAYDTLEEISYIVLPNGYGFVMSAYTNGYEPSEPEIDNMSYLAELLIDGLGLSKGLPQKYIYGANDLKLSGDGWSMESSKQDKYGDRYAHNTGKSGAVATWTVNLPADGIYEVSVWAPEDSQGSSVSYSLDHAYGTDQMSTSQRVNGGRWVKLGDFNFLANKTAILRATAQGKPFNVNAVKFHLWPSCYQIPGTACNLQ